MRPLEPACNRADVGIRPYGFSLITLPDRGRFCVCNQTQNRPQSAGLPQSAKLQSAKKAFPSEGKVASGGLRLPDDG
jgi:hypothetical protein